ncbi:MAG: TOBE domain-containing protein [Campylobacterales bacterium]|nr:TOBE domain-containing protein [Campylobacterales bacterium]
MNKLLAKVERIHSDPYFTVVHLHVEGETRLRTIKTECPQWLGIGDAVACHIPEAALSICKGSHEGDVSIENRLSARLEGVLRGEVLSEVTLATSCGALKSLISTEACERMAMSTGEEVTLLLKAVDIKLHPLL